MECPKCLAACADDLTECPQCGVVFAKLAQRGPDPADGSVAVPQMAPPPTDDAPADPVRKLVIAGRAVVLVGLLLLTWQFARDSLGSGSDTFLHLPNLVFHEAGHVLLSVFGRFMGVLGGSLFQFALPLGLAAAFLRQRDPFGASVCTWWAGQNLVDVAPYIADARSLQIVLLGGKTGAEAEGHDWEYILGELGWLHLDRTLGLGVRRTGLVIMIAALIWGAMSAARRAPRSETS
jgi:hypothetical protein